MSAMEVVAMIVAGGVGAGLRYAVDRVVTAHRPGRIFPVAILVVNVGGSFGLGLIAGLGELVAPGWVGILGVGLLGGFTTFSTVSLDSARFARDGRRDLAWANIVGTFAACVIAASTGLVLGGLRFA